MYSPTIPEVVKWQLLNTPKNKRLLKLISMILYNKEGGSLLFEVLLHPEVKAIILLKLQDLLQSLPLDELPHSPAVRNLQQVGLEVIVSEAKVEELLGVVLHLLEFHLDHTFGDLSDVDWRVDAIRCDLE